jgi:hypothetical protein
MDDAVAETSTALFVQPRSLSNVAVKRHFLHLTALETEPKVLCDV